MYNRRGKVLVIRTPRWSDGSSVSLTPTALDGVKRPKKRKEPEIPEDRKGPGKTRRGTGSLQRFFLIKNVAGETKVWREGGK